MKESSGCATHHEDIPLDILSSCHSLYRKIILISWFISFRHNGRYMADRPDAATNRPLRISMARSTSSCAETRADPRSSTNYQNQQPHLRRLLPDPFNPNPLVKPRAFRPTTIPRFQVLRVRRYLQRSCQRRHHRHPLWRSTRSITPSCTRTLAASSSLGQSCRGRGRCNLLSG